MCTEKKREDGYEQSLQTQLQQNYLVSNFNKVCGQKATSEVMMRLFYFFGAFHSITCKYGYCRLCD
jgi:hypothetical protein